VKRSTISCFFSSFGFLFFRWVPSLSWGLPDAMWMQLFVGLFLLLDARHESQLFPAGCCNAFLTKITIFLFPFPPQPVEFLVQEDCFKLFLEAGLRFGISLPCRPTYDASMGRSLQTCFPDSTPFTPSPFSSFFPGAEQKDHDMMIRSFCQS